MTISRISSSAFFALFSISLLLTGCSTPPADDAMMDNDEEMMMEDEGMIKEDTMMKNDDAMMEDGQAMACKTKNEACESSSDCCGSMGLECQEVNTSSGLAKRCMPAEVLICKSDCTDGTWSKPRGCRTAVAPKDMMRCESFVGDTCNPGNTGSRTTRECADT